MSTYGELHDAYNSHLQKIQNLINSQQVDVKKILNPKLKELTKKVEAAFRNKYSDEIMPDSEDDILYEVLNDSKKEIVAYIPRKELDGEQEPSGWEKTVRVAKYVAAAVLFLAGLALIGFGVATILAAPGIGIAPGAFLTTLGLGALGASAVIGIGAGAAAAGLLSTVGGGLLARSLRQPAEPQPSPSDRDEVINIAEIKSNHFALQINRVFNKRKVLEGLSPVAARDFAEGCSNLSKEFLKEYNDAYDASKETFTITHDFVQRLNALEDKIDAATKKAREAETKEH